jgi:hypothetical protein
LKRVFWQKKNFFSKKSFRSPFHHEAAAAAAINFQVKKQ